MRHLALADTNSITTREPLAFFGCHNVNATRYLGYLFAAQDPLTKSYTPTEKVAYYHRYARRHYRRGYRRGYYGYGYGYGY